ncbi:hypothetical protein Ahy_A04g020563 [Arachis hypogaea]|uniref:Uncharacterized protein n=1 Tax=Arachis hypogaea TaxID=3818 RepID=A0A445DI01_ARAHY|nr:hypothetical protein Ahy_A04g020563 [Arachis hypogaea]
MEKSVLVEFCRCITRPLMNVFKLLVGMSYTLVRREQGGGYLQKTLRRSSHYSKTRDIPRVTITASIVLVEFCRCIARPSMNVFKLLVGMSYTSARREQGGGYLQKTLRRSSQTLHSSLKFQFHLFSAFHHVSPLSSVLFCIFCVPKALILSKIFSQSVDFKLWLIIENGPKIPKKIVGGVEIEKSEDEFDKEDMNNMG